MSLLAHVSRIVRDVYDHWRPQRLLSRKTGPYRVIRVIDGDTLCLLMDGTAERVRLIGIDSPETVHPASPPEPFGAQSSQMAKELLSGRSVMLRYKEAERRDRYDRILAYVYRVPDGLFINREMIRLGGAKAYPFNGHPYEEDFARAEDEARSAELGLWKYRRFPTIEGAQPMHNANGHEPYFLEENGFRWAANHCGLVSCLPQHIQRIIQDGELKKKRELASNGDAESEIDWLRRCKDSHEEQRLTLERELSEKRQEADCKEVELARLRVEREKPTSAELEPTVDPPHNDGPAKQNISWKHLITGVIASLCGVLLAFYLIFFYASAIDKAFFLDVDSQVKSGTYAGLNDIVNPSALKNSLEGNPNWITILAPFIFLAFAVAVHHFFERRSVWKVVALLVFTLLFDGILAVQISQKIHQANVRMGLEKGEWDFGIISLVTDPIANLDIWTVIFCGFVTSVLVSIVYHVAVERLNDMRWPTSESKQYAKNEKESRRRLQVTIDNEKNERQQKLSALEVEIQNLRKETDQLEIKIASRQADIEKASKEIEDRSIQAKRVKMVDRDNMESQVNQFLNGWLRYVAHSGAGDSQIGEAKTVARNTLNQYYER